MDQWEDDLARGLAVAWAEGLNFVWAFMNGRNVS